MYHWLALDRLRYVRTVGGAVRIDAASLFQAPEPDEFKKPEPPADDVARTYARFRASLEAYRAAVAKAKDRPGQMTGQIAKG